ncbi:hypothetical protein GC169_00490 [bacterium]|nr:hypothetical protein [bacterium]
MKRARVRDGAGEKGAALVTVLVTVALLSATAAAVVDTARFSTKRAANQAEMAQIRWHYLGAETLALTRLRAALEVDGAGFDWAGILDRPIVFPLDAGVMTATIRDGGKCFNVNSLLEADESGAAMASLDRQVVFGRLVEQTTGAPGLPVAAVVADWIDPDEQPGLGGAEASAYRAAGALTTPPNLPIADIGELAGMEGLSRDQATRLARVACARPSLSPNAININALQPEDAPLIAAIFGRELPVAAAEDVIRDRPAGGWREVDAFLAHPRLVRITLSQEAISQFSLRPRWFVLSASIQYGGSTETGMTLIDATAGVPRVVRRVLGVAPDGGLL